MAKNKAFQDTMQWNYDRHIEYRQPINLPINLPAGQEKAVLASIKSEFNNHIIHGSKTIELRRTSPVLTPPFRVYWHLTKNPGCRVTNEIRSISVVYKIERVYLGDLSEDEWVELENNSCVLRKEICEYARYNPDNKNLKKKDGYLYLWHLANTWLIEWEGVPIIDMAPQSWAYIYNETELVNKSKDLAYSIECQNFLYQQQLKEKTV